MKTIELDKVGGVIRATFYRGGIKERFFKTREEAEAFATKMMGKKGCIISTLDMTPEQLSAHIERQRKAKDLALQIIKQGEESVHND